MFFMKIQLLLSQFQNSSVNKTAILSPNASGLASWRRWLHLALIVIFSLFWGCSRSSLDDFQHEAEGICRHLVQELKKIETRDDLAKTEGTVKKLFYELADLTIAAQAYQEKHSDETPSGANSYNEALKAELIRVYGIEGGREFIEKNAREALIRLDASLGEHPKHRK